MHLSTTQAPNADQLCTRHTYTDICGGLGTVMMMIMITIKTSDWGGFAYLRLELKENEIRGTVPSSLASTVRTRSKNVIGQAIRQLLP